VRVAEDEHVAVGECGDALEGGAVVVDAHGERGDVGPATMDDLQRSRLGNSRDRSSHRDGVADELALAQDRVRSAR
jgi:hypothetical protein